ncbi:DUF4292 domain-containing protein [Bergeyella sp. RCAD1439]|uniref:DUF4292 domain-containing protein n=1 Tax=Bergeyella anatis TaxID=3113737 RepID=UPI002E18BDEE|nr:DUF4292 domain-containing protein [Bergeyella sp. RCAD1439]
MKKLVFILFSVFFLWSCKTKTAVISEPLVKPKTNEKADFIKKITRKATFEQVKINSKIDVQMGRFVPPIEATVYIENGEKIWMNMAAVFINVARGVATPQGIQGYEKWNRTYLDSDYAYLNRLLNVNFIDYSSLQNLLTGRVFVPVNESDFQWTTQGSGYRLNSVNPQKITVDGKTMGYTVSMEYTSGLDLSKVVLKEDRSSSSLEVWYEDWGLFGGERFPKSVKIIIKGDKNGQVLIENTKFDFSRMQTPYAVPSNYTKAKI